MKDKLNWNIFSNQDRNSVIDCLKTIISSADGYIVNANFFSDLAVNLAVDIEEKNIKKLHALIDQEMSVSELDGGKLDQDSEKEWRIFLNTNFGKGTGNVKISIPDVPG